LQHHVLVGNRSHSVAVSIISARPVLAAWR
jgi:hypothetical protein